MPVETNFCITHNKRLSDIITALFVSTNAFAMIKDPLPPVSETQDNDVTGVEAEIHHDPEWYREKLGLRTAFNIEGNSWFKIPEKPTAEETRMYEARYRHIQNYLSDIQREIDQLSKDQATIVAAIRRLDFRAAQLRTLYSQMTKEGFVDRTKLERLLGEIVGLVTGTTAE